jgi:hypothetical protein
MYDAGTIAELMDDYKTFRKVSKDDELAARDEKARADLKNATTEKGSGDGDTSRKPRYKRSELIRLKIEQPGRYEAMADKIREAYRDGRVI